MSSHFADSAVLRLAATAPADVSESRNRLAEEVVALFDEYREPLLRYLASMSLPFPDGEEVVQEAFLSLFQHLQRGRPRDNLRGWLFRVAHNLALKRRYQTRRDFEACSGAEHRAVDPRPSPEAQTVNHQTHLRVLAIIQALPVQDRRCLALRAEGLRYREIAGILGWSLGSVSLSLARSLARIARATGR